MRATHGPIEVTTASGKKVTVELYPHASAKVWPEDRGKGPLLISTHPSLCPADLKPVVSQAMKQMMQEVAGRVVM
jgi:hypothetical protein